MGNGKYDSPFAITDSLFTIYFSRLPSKAAALKEKGIQYGPVDEPGTELKAQCQKIS